MSEDDKLKLDRSDRATRLFLDGLDELALQVRKLDLEVAKLVDRMEHYVSYKALMAFLIAALVAEASLMAWYGARVNAVADAMTDANAAAQTKRSEELERRLEQQWGSKLRPEDLKPQEKPKRR